MAVASLEWAGKRWGYANSSHPRLGAAEHALLAVSQRTPPERFYPPGPLMVSSTRLDSFRPSLVQMAPWAAQFRSDGQHDGHIGVRGRLDSDLPPDVLARLQPPHLG